MPTAIAVTSPDLALPATDRQTPAAVVLQAPHRQPLDEALTELSAVLEHHGHLVVLYSSACPPEHIRRLHTLRAVLESDRIAILPMSLPPLGVALLARQLRQLSLCDFSPGVLASAARLLAHYIHAGALLGSVSGLDRVEVDLRSHMKSWLPGAHFAVLANPEPQLLHLDRHGTQAGLRAPGFATQLAVARGQLTAEWVTGSLAPAWQVQGAYEARLPAESARWWGTQKLIEFAAAIPDLSVLYQLVASVRREQCGWCGLEVLGDRCAFCAAPLARNRATGGGASARGPAAIEGPGRAAEDAATPAVPAPATPAVPAPIAPAVPAPATPAVPAPATPAVPAPTAPAVPAPTAPAVPAPTAPAVPAPTAPAVPAPTAPPAFPTTAPPAAPPPAPGPPPSGPWAERGLAPVAPSGVPGAPGATGVAGAAGVNGVRGGGTVDRGTPGQVDVRGPALAPGSGPGALGTRYGTGCPVPGNPYAADAPRVPGRWDLPGHPDFAGEPDAPGVPRTVARVR
ncbi:hypothetical protein AB0C96_16045 [Streptomyces sp. NPDC048506]|uniref:hypothetical protein n=1 Tax=Streptomyces sp. NPDC048506 TaxID=3155028 RepID=UPI00343D5F4A